MSDTEEPPELLAPALTNDTSDASSASIYEQPPTPVPSSEPSLVVAGVANNNNNTNNDGPSTPPQPPPEDNNPFALPPCAALQLLTTNIEMLVRITGDIPPTPPPRMPTDPQMSGLQAEKESIVRSHSDNNLARLRQQQGKPEHCQTPPTTTATTTVNVVPSVTGKRPCDDQVHCHDGGKTKLQAYSAAMTVKLASQAPAVGDGIAEIDGVALKSQATGRPLPPTTRSSPTSSQPPPYIIVGADSQPLNLQHGAITRKFYSKNEPPIGIGPYLQRLHQFCPMSVAVYLAASLYIHRLAAEQRAIPVTRRNAHRLVLAALRVAMKALEDLPHSHSRFAKVGGVSGAELARLEISFCFLAGFELVVREEALTAHWGMLRGGQGQEAAEALRRMEEVPTLRLDRDPREVAA